MPRSSRASLSDETIQELENQFYDFLSSLSHDERRKFFSEFLTNEEKMMMYKRLALYWCLLEGYSLAKIQQMIGVTHDTTRVYNKKKNMLSEEFKSLIARIGRSDDNQPQEEHHEQISEQENHDEHHEEYHESHDGEQIEKNEDQEEHHEEFHVEPNNNEVHDEHHEEYHEEQKMEESTYQENIEQQMKDENVTMPYMEEGSSEEETMEQSSKTSQEMAESSGFAPSESGHDNDDKNDKDNNDSGEKKSGLRKFFGF